MARPRPGPLRRGEGGTGAERPGDRDRLPRGQEADATRAAHLRQTEAMDNLKYSDSIVVARAPQDLYDMVSDVTRMGEWSPVCKACWWDQGAGPEVGAWFTGHNELPERTWETRSQVVVANRGHEFAFVVGASSTRWGYTFVPVDGGTEIIESWELPPEGVAMFEERFGADAPAQIANRVEAAHKGIAATLASIKRAAEAS